jgi:hypothetical protein
MSAAAARSVVGSIPGAPHSMYTNVRPASAPGGMKGMGVLLLVGSAGVVDVGGRGGGAELRDESVQDARGISGWPT